MADVLILGTTGETWFTERRIVVEAVARDRYELCAPGDCPLCAAGVPLEDVTAP